MKKAKKQKKQKKENSEGWLLTYSDLITLLMILFILLFAMSNVNQEKYEALSESLSASMGGGAGILSGSDSVLPEGDGDSVVDIDKEGDDGKKQESTISSSITEVPTPTIVQAPSKEKDDLSGRLSSTEDMQKLDTSLKAVLEDMDIGEYASTALTDSGLKISFANDVFFDSGKDILKPEMKKGLGEIALLLNKIDNDITIEGHTDNVPISKINDFTSNWQLSAARAANVAQYLCDKERIDGSRVMAAGFGEYRPVASNDTKEGRSMNRRVDIIILYDSFNHQ
jgi:chemotaxis protein MotB